MTIATVRQRDMQDRGKGFLYTGNGKGQHLKARVFVRPLHTVIVRGLVDHDCNCTIVLHNVKKVGQTEFWRELKYVHKACPHHAHIPCIAEPSG